MEINEREHHIKVLEKLLKETNGKIELYSENKNIDLTKEKEIVETLGYVISSLKTDFKYDLMYEGEEIFTKDEVIDMLEKLKKVIESQPTYSMPITDSSGLICYGCSEREPSAKDAAKHIQAKINALRGMNE